MKITNKEVALLCDIFFVVFEFIVCKFNILDQGFSNHGSQPKCRSPKVYEWVTDTSRAFSTLMIFKFIVRQTNILC